MAMLQFRALPSSGPICSKARFPRWKAVGANEIFRSVAFLTLLSNEGKNQQRLLDLVVRINLLLILTRINTVVREREIHVTFVVLPQTANIKAPLHCKSLGKMEKTGGGPGSVRRVLAVSLPEPIF